SYLYTIPLPHFLSFFLLLILPPPTSPLFPYTTLFRSLAVHNGPDVRRRRALLFAGWRNAQSRQDSQARQPTLHDRNSFSMGCREPASGEFRRPSSLGRNAGRQCRRAHACAHRG